jgi:hypothetical protein
MRGRRRGIGGVKENTRCQARKTREEERERERKSEVTLVLFFVL